MDDPLAVGGFQGLGDLLTDLQRLLDGQRASGEPLLKRLPLDQFEDEEAGAPFFFEGVDGGDVGVVQRRQQMGLALQPCEALRVGAQFLGQDLDRHLTLQLGIPRPIHLTHTALTERFKDFVMT